MGRPSKGERVTIAAKPYPPLAEVIRQNAADLHLSAGDYLVAIAAEALGMPDQSPVVPRHVNNELDIQYPINSPANLTTAEELRIRLAS